MPFSIDVDEAAGLAVARCDGAVLEAEIHQAIDFSFEAKRLPPGVGRVVYIAPTADLRALDPEALHRIQDHVFDLSGRDGAPAFRSVLVAPSAFHRPIAELYKAIWDSHELPGVEFSVVTAPEEAAGLFGLPAGAPLAIRAPAGDRHGPG